MANIKFSAFDAGGSVDTSTARVVGFKHLDTSANYYYTIADLAAMLSPSISTIYAADGTIGTTRKALITDTIQFRDSGDTYDLLNINSNGTFTLGKSAANGGGYSNVSIGDSASTASTYGVAVGRLAVLGASHSYATAVGNQATSGGAFSVQIGAGSTAGEDSISIGYSSGSAASYAHNYGHDAEGSADNSITFNASGTSAAAPSTQYAFGVYMTSNTTPDFEVVGSGESTLNTNLKITGQGYTELHDTTNTTLTVDWNNSNIQELTSLTGSLTFTASNPKAGATYILTLAQTGTVTATWTGVKWPAATAPTLSGAGKTDVITLICYDATGAGLYYGASTLNFTT